MTQSTFTKTTLSAAIIFVALLLLSSTAFAERQELVAIKSMDTGRYARANTNGDVTFTYKNINVRETHLMTTHSDGRVSFQNKYGKYWRAVSGGGKAVKSDRTTSLAHEKFTLSPSNLPGIPSFIFANNGRALRNNNGKLDARGNHINIHNHDIMELKVVRLGTITEAEFAGTPTDVGDGEWSYSGDIRLPLPGGQHITLASAEVTITYDAFGNVDTMIGTTDLPILPAGGLLGRLGQFVWGSGPESELIELGYGKPSTFDTFGLPLDRDGRYYYLTFSPGAALGWAGLDIGGDLAEELGGLIMVIDPDTSSLFMYCDLPVFGAGLNAIGFGVSQYSGITFDPNHNDVPVLGGFNREFGGEVFLTANVSVFQPFPGVSLGIDGDMTMRVGDNTFANNGLISRSVGVLGANAEVYAEFSIGPMSISDMHLGAATLIVRDWSSSTSFMGLKADIGPDEEIKLPFGITLDTGVSGDAELEAYVDENPNDSNEAYLSVEAELDRFANQRGVKLKGTFELHEDDGMEFSGHASFAGLNINVSGEISQNDVRLCGSKGGGWDVNLVTRVEFNVHACLDLDDPGIDTWGSGSVCVFGECVSASTNVNIKSDGGLEVCVGNYCQEL